MASNLQVQPGPYYTITGNTVSPAANADPLSAYATAGPYAYYVKQPDGTYAPAVLNQAMQQDPQDTQLFDPSKGLFFNQINGQKAYETPQASYAPDTPAPTGGGLLHQNPVFNRATGQYEQGPLDWGNIASLGVAGALTGGALDAFAGGGAGTAADAGAPTLEGLSAGGEVGATTIPEGVAPSSLVAGAAGEGSAATAIPSGAAATGAGAAPALWSGAAPAATTAAAASSPSLWSKISTIGGIGVPIAGALINAHEQSNATAAQVAAAQAALDFQKQVYNERKAGLQPFQALGTGAANRLGSLWGFPSSIAIPTVLPNTSTGNGTGPALAQLKPGQNVGTVLGGNSLNTPTTLASLGTSGASPGAPNLPAQAGEMRIVNGQQAQWDGNGWVAA